MKRTLLIILLAVGFTSYESFAQIALGVKGGLNFNLQSIDVAQSGGSVADVADSRTGFHFGAFASFKLGPISIQPEAFYSAQGAELSYQSASGAVKTDYLQVPILVKLSFLKVLNVHAGPQFGFLLNEAIEGDAEDLVDQALENDISIAAGVGLNLPFGLSVDLRYVKGTKDAFKFDPSAGGLATSTTNDLIQLSVGYTLLGKD